MPVKSDVAALPDQAGNSGTLRFIPRQFQAFFDKCEDGQRWPVEIIGGKTSGSRINVIGFVKKERPVRRDSPEKDQRCARDQRQKEKPAKGVGSGEHWHQFR
jgi:hypothetical protein